MSLLREYIKESIISERSPGRSKYSMIADKQRARKAEKETTAGSTDHLKKYGKQTIGDALEDIAKAKKLQTDTLLSTSAFDKARDGIVGEIPGYSAIASWIGHINDRESIKSGETISGGATFIKTDIRDFPLLDKLDLYEGYIKILNKRVLRYLTSAYEDNILKNARVSASVSSLKDINEFAEEWIFSEYNIKVSK